MPKTELRMVRFFYSTFFPLFLRPGATVMIFGFLAPSDKPRFPSCIINKSSENTEYSNSEGLKPLEKVNKKYISFFPHIIQPLRAKNTFEFDIREWGIDGGYEDICIKAASMSEKLESNLAKILFF